MNLKSTVGASVGAVVIAATSFVIGTHKGQQPPAPAPTATTGKGSVPRPEGPPGQYGAPPVVAPPVVAPPVTQPPATQPPAASPPAATPRTQPPGTTAVTLKNFNLDGALDGEQYVATITKADRSASTVCTVAGGDCTFFFPSDIVTGFDIEAFKRTVQRGTIVSVNVRVGPPVVECEKCNRKPPAPPPTIPPKKGK